MRDYGMLLEKLLRNIGDNLKHQSISQTFMVTNLKCVQFYFLW